MSRLLILFLNDLFYQSSPVKQVFVLLDVGDLLLHATHRHFCVLKLIVHFHIQIFHFFDLFFRGYDFLTSAKQ